MKISFKLTWWHLAGALLVTLLLANLGDSISMKAKSIRWSMSEHGESGATAFNP